MSNNSKAYFLGGTISIVAFENAIGEGRAKTDKDFNQAALDAKELGITLPPLPAQTGDLIGNDILLRDYLSKKISDPIGQVIKETYGAREATFFHISLNINSVYWLFLKGDAQTRKMLLPAYLNVIKMEADFVEAPPETVAKIANLQIDTDYETAKNIISDTDKKFVSYLLIRQLVDNGSNYFNRQQYTEAVKEYSKAINANANFVEAYYRRGAALEELKLYDLAVADFTKAINLMPEDGLSARRLPIIYAERCNANLQKNDLAAAELDCTRSIRLTPSNGAYYIRGLIRLIQANYQSALDDFSFAITFDPNDAGAFYYRGLTYQKAGRKELSETDFKKAEALQPGILASHRAN